MAKNIPLEELVSLPNFYMVQPNWQQTKAAFYWDKTGRIELYELDLATREVKQISHGEVPRVLRAGFAWNRAGNLIIFAKDTLGNEQHDLFSITMPGGEVKQLTADGACQKYPVQFSPDDRWLLVASNKVGQMNVWKMRPNGEEWMQITKNMYPASPVCWSPDGQRIAYVTNETPDLKNLDGYIINAIGSDSRQVFHVKEGSQDVISDWHPDGTQLAVTSDASGVNQAGILNLDTGEVRWLSEAGIDESSGKFSSDGRWLTAMVNHESQVRPVLYEVESGNRHELKLPPGMGFGSAFVNQNKDLLVTFATDTARPSLFLYHIDGDTYEVLLQAEYSSINPDVFVPSEHIYYRSFDGRDIPALLYHSKETGSDHKLPAVVIVHGGPTGQFFRGFDAYAQYLVDQGYVVLEPNIRGSTGYGVEFRDMALKDWGGGDLEDVAAGVDYLKSLPYVDPDRIAIFGISYGGYMTYIAATKKPNLWKVAVPVVGITDLPRLYNESMEHFKYYLRQQMGDPEELADLWHDRSAINFAQNLSAKMLIVHGVNDPRCPIDQARAFRDRLVELGRKEGQDFEYVEFADEGHSSNDIQQKLRSYRLLGDFLARTL